ncbi:hypothetical protein FRC91_10350 [Bradymonadales bacterium TMQ1]|nr:hypothetical protein FRC91_10350 [Bradymonadales bacterium TMQ1]
MRRWLVACALWACVLTQIGCQTGPACGTFPLDADTRRCMVSTIDTMVREHYPFAEQKGVDMTMFFKGLWSSLDEPELDDESFVLSLAQSLAMLEDGHTRLERFRLDEVGAPPVKLALREGQVVVRSAAPGARLKPGEVIETIDGKPALPVLRSALASAERGSAGEVLLLGADAALAGEVGSVVRLETASGRVVQLTRQTVLHEPFIRRFGEIGYLRVKTFGFIDDLDRLDRLINALMDTRGLIIDLRDNGGGYPSVSDGLFGRLVAEDGALFALVDRQGRVHRHMQAHSRGETYTGQVVVLVNEGTFSAANYFAHRIREEHRGVLLGGRTGGGAASPDRGLMLVDGLWFQVSTYVVETLSGHNTEEGMAPTIHLDDVGAWYEVPPEQGALSEDNDRMLRRARRYLEGVQ